MSTLKSRDIESTTVRLMAECACGTSASSPLSDTEVDRRVDQLKALSNPVRLRMVDLIYHGGGEICVCEFMDHFDLSQPTISHHLKVLRESGLVKSRKDGTFVYHRVDEQAFSALNGLMTRLSTTEIDRDRATPVEA